MWRRDWDPAQASRSIVYPHSSPGHMGGPPPAPARGVLVVRRGASEPGRWSAAGARRQVGGSDRGVMGPVPRGDGGWGRGAPRGGWGPGWQPEGFARKAPTPIKVGNESGRGGPAGGGERYPHPPAMSHSSQGLKEPARDEMEEVTQQAEKLLRLTVHPAQGESTTDFEIRYQQELVALCKSMMGLGVSGPVG